MTLLNLLFKIIYLQFMITEAFLILIPQNFVILVLEEIQNFFLISNVYLLIMICFLKIIFYNYVNCTSVETTVNLMETNKIKYHLQYNLNIKNISIYINKNNIKQNDYTGICVYLRFKRLEVSFLNIFFKEVFSVEIEKQFLTLFLTNELSHLLFEEVKCFQLLSNKNNYISIYFYCFFKEQTLLKNKIDIIRVKRKLELLVPQIFLISNKLKLHESYCELFSPLQVVQNPFIDTRIPSLNQKYTTYRTYRY